MPKVASPLPERLKAARLRAGLSQKVLGVAAGLDEFVASARMNQYERGVHAPNYAMAQRLADVLGVPTAYLFADNDTDAALLLDFHTLPAAARRRFLARLRGQA